MTQTAFLILWFTCGSGKHPCKDNAGRAFSTIEMPSIGMCEKELKRQISLHSSILVGIGGTCVRNHG